MVAAGRRRMAYMGLDEEDLGQQGEEAEGEVEQSKEAAVGDEERTLHIGENYPLVKSTLAKPETGCSKNI